MGYQEILGYVASLVVLISLLMSSVKKLRWINMIGSMVFAVYGFLIGAIPVAVMNLGIVCINLYYLYQMYTKKDFFTLLPLNERAYFQNFLEFHKNDITSFMTIDDDYQDASYEKIFILRNTVPAGLVVGKKIDNETFEILIDYVTPSYRDFKIGNFLYETQKQYFTEQGYKKIVTKPGNEKHQAYLTKMGFEKGDIYIKTL